MPKDGHIKLLPLHVANKIAAGEVVERPASVVKELVENAIDARAKRIDITITAGGRKLIGVRDDGCGMERDDALLCLERQATSKISDVEDIERIDTLGFRGEAIPSIASVSRMLIKTRRPQDDAGIQLTVTGGTLQEVHDIGTPSGTDIEVRDLFFNVPVRRKFLRAYQTEQAHIRSVLTLHALAHPDVGFTLSADGRELYNLPPGATLKERAVELFGRDFVADLRVIDYQAGAIHVYGYASLPTQTRNDRSEQYVFVNRRPATAPVIAYALREAYPPMDTKEKPILLLFIDLPPECVDVNVHPTKREVRFTHPADVREAIILAVSRAIGRERPSIPAGGAASPLPAVPPPNSGFRGVATVSPVPPDENPFAGKLPTPQRPMELPDPPLKPAPVVETPLQPEPFDYPRPDPLDAVPQPPAATLEGEGIPLFASPAPCEGAPWKWSRVIGQVADRFVLAETDSGYVTLDPVAARERILYEKLMAGLRKGEVLSQQLLFPESVRLAPADSVRLRNHLDALRAMGFEIEDFGDDHFKVEALPAVAEEAGISCRELLANIAQDFELGGVRRGAEKWREEIIARSICHTSSLRTMKLRDEDAQKLIDALAAAEMPYTSPRGKPTMIFTSYRELDRKFGR